MEQWKKKITSFFAWGLLIIWLPSLTAFGQQEQYIRPGLLTVAGTLSPSVLLNRKEVNYYFMGYIEGKFHPNFSVRGDIYIMTGNASTKFLRHNIRSFIGILYGYPFGNLESHVGFLPGFSVMESNVNRGKFEFVPSIEFSVGIRYYVWKYFNFFADASYIHAKMNSIRNVNGMADDVSFNVGLGFNLNVIRSQTASSKHD